MDFAGCGALNLDIIYELQSSDFSNVLGFDLQPGHEVVLPHERLAATLKRLDEYGKLIARSGGGSAANTMCILAAMGRETMFLGVAGADIAGEEVIASMRGVNTSLVQRLNENQVCIVLLSHKSRDRGLCVFSASQSFLEVPEIWLNALANVRCLHLSSFSNSNQIRIQEELINHLKEHQLLSLDPGEIYSALGRERLAKLLKRTNLLFITEHEVELLTGMAVPDGVKCLLSMLCSNQPECKIFEQTAGAVVVVKQGKNGAVVFGANGLILQVNALEVKNVVDTTGAGDAFNAGFLNAMFAGEALEVCMQVGHRIAALSISDFGRNWLNALKVSNGVLRQVRETIPPL